MPVMAQLARANIRRDGMDRPADAFCLQVEEFGVSYGTVSVSAFKAGTLKFTGFLTVLSPCLLGSPLLRHPRNNVMCFHLFSFFTNA